MATLLSPDGTRRTVNPAHGSAFTLEELQTFVGGHIQVLPLRTRQRSYLVCHEEGKLENLPRNALATARAGRALLPGDWIAGPALVVSTQELGE